MTDELFREDASLLECLATVVAIDDTGIVLDRTVCYPVEYGSGTMRNLRPAAGRRGSITWRW